MKRKRPAKEEEKARYSAPLKKARQSEGRRSGLDAKDMEGMRCARQLAREGIKKGLRELSESQRNSRDQKENTYGSCTFAVQAVKRTLATNTTTGSAKTDTGPENDDTSSESESESDLQVKSEITRSDKDCGTGVSARSRSFESPEDGKKLGSTQKSCLRDSGYVEEALLPHQQLTGSTPRPQKIYAVRIGWFPGLYYDCAKANAQRHRYPGGQMKGFESMDDAKAFVSAAGPDDFRPTNADRIDRDGWTRFVQHTWDKSNAIPGIDEKTDILPKLKSLFAAAAEAEFRVDWARHPLPQTLLQDENHYTTTGHMYERNFDLQRLSMKSPERSSVVMEKARDTASSYPDRADVPICDCGLSDSPNRQDEVVCANRECKIGRYHAACHGLAGRRAAPSWRCRYCRVQIPNVMTGAASTIHHTNADPPEAPLSAEQASVVKLILEGGNVCYTGSAGTGKSTVLRAAVRALRKQGKRVDIVAPSGIAALAVGGQTTFVYAGWTPDTFKQSLDKIVDRAHGRIVWKRLTATDVLIIEEISMIDSHFFERLEMLCRATRDSMDHEPNPRWLSPHDGDLQFGGMQVIVTGDFCQLPPVRPFKFCLHCGGDELPGWKHNRGGPLTCPICRKVYKDDEKWAFQNDSWSSCDFTYVELTQIHRQSEKEFTRILQKCRRKIRLTQSDKNLLLHHPSETKDAVQLRPTSAEVEKINSREFNRLPGEVREYECLDLFD